MNRAEKGNTVEVSVLGKTPDGAVAIETSKTAFKVGEGEVIPGIEEAVMGMEVGESKTAEVPADKAFGQYDARRTIQVRPEQLPAGQAPEVGGKVLLRSAQGESVMAKITEVGPAAVTLDYNHPLAGNDLKFEIKLLNVT